MKKYVLKNKFVLIEKDETTDEQSIIGIGDDAMQFNKFYSLGNVEKATDNFYIPRDDGTVFVIENVARYDVDYEDYGFILYQKENENGKALYFAYLFEGNRILELGRSENDDFFINDEKGKELVAYISENRLIYFSFISYFIRDEDYFFEIEAGKFRIFTNSFHELSEKTEEQFYSCSDENDVMIYLQRDGDLYREIIRTKSLILFHNAYLIQNETNRRYELYGFKDGKPYLLGDGKEFEIINEDIRLDNLIWKHSEDIWLLQYKPKKYKTTLWKLW